MQSHQQMLSIPHLIIIFLVALVVLGPEKLPQVARMMGKAMADFRRITTDFRVQIEDEMQEMERQTRIKKEAGANEATIASALPAVMPPVETPAPTPAATEDPLSRLAVPRDWTGEEIPADNAAVDPSSDQASHQIGQSSNEAPGQTSDQTSDQRSDQPSDQASRVNVPEPVPAEPGHTETHTG